MWVGINTAFNEAKFVEKSIRSVIDEVDRYIIVEGCWKNGESVTGSLRSTDGTIEILENLQKQYPNKLEIIFANEQNEQRQRDKYLERLNDGDYVVWTDSDEIVHTHELKEAKEYCKYMFEKIGHQMIFSHYVNVFDTGAVKDTHLRGAFFKFRKDLRYMDNERIKNNPGEVYLFSDYGKGPLYNKSMPVIPEEIYRIFHFKFCKDLSNLVDRRLMYDIIWDKLPSDKIEERRNTLEEEYRNAYKSGLKRENIYEGPIP